MSNSRQSIEFRKYFGEELPKSLLDTCLDWIRAEMSPEEVYKDDRLKKFISDTCMPEEVFSADELSKWASENGFKKIPERHILSAVQESIDKNKVAYEYRIVRYKEADCLLIEDLLTGNESVTDNLPEIVKAIEAKENIDARDYYIAWKDTEGKWDGWCVKGGFLHLVEKTEWQLCIDDQLKGNLLLTH